MKNSLVSYVQGSIPQGAEAAALWQALGVADSLRRSRTAFIKLNLCAAQRYDSTTGICVRTEAVADLVRSLHAVAPDLRIMVGDSDSTGYGFAHDKFSHQGLQVAAESAGFELVDLTRDETVLVECGGEFFKAVPLARSVAEADFLISFSKIKTHNITRVTGTLKNGFGMLPMGEKKKLHPFLDQVLTDIYRANPPELCVLDGQPAMQGNGPIHGEPVDLGLTLFGNDALATDTEMCRLIGVDPHKVSHLRYLARHLERDLDAPIACVGTTPRPVARPFLEIPGNQRRLIQFGLRIQALGANLEEFGHLVHFARKLGDVQKVKRFLARMFRKGRVF